MKPRAPLRTRLAMLMLLTGVMSAAGCLPGATWLPDSSGLVYTTAGGELRIFDVTTGKTEVVTKSGSGTIWPAVSPDGKRFAVASLTSRDAGGAGFDAKYQLEVQVVVCDRAGKMLHKSALQN
jgi:hypothetical protein